jgi:hypothetical protein
MNESKCPFNIKYLPRPLSIILRDKTCQYLGSQVGKAGSAFEKTRRTVLGLCCNLCLDAANHKKALQNISKLVILGDEYDMLKAKQYGTSQSLAELQAEQLGRSYTSEAVELQFLDTERRTKHEVKRQFEKPVDGPNGLLKQVQGSKLLRRCMLPSCAARSPLSRQCHHKALYCTTQTKHASHSNTFQHAPC